MNVLYRFRVRYMTDGGGGRDTSFVASIIDPYAACRHTRSNKCHIPHPHSWSTSFSLNAERCSIM
jgi:hypothetical protein